MIPADGEAAKYWTRWRGPSGQGVAAGSYPDNWSSTTNVAWKKPVPGRGNSSPIVWRDRIVITTAYDNGRRVSVLAFRRTDGARLWETFVTSGRASSSHYKNGHASATPATDGERVYVSFGGHGLAALDLNGAIVWQRDLGPMDAYHGTAGSPLVYRDRLILYQDQFVRLVHRRIRRAHGAHAVADQPRMPASAGARRSPSAPATTTRSSSTANAPCMRTIRTPAVNCGGAAAATTR